MSKGNPIQQAAFRALKVSRVMEVLRPFSGVVAGTIPLGIDIPGSDIDILCRCGDFGALAYILESNYGDQEGFAVDTSANALVCSFFVEGMEIEVFAQDIPVWEQNGYRHLVTEYRLLEMYGEDLRQRVIGLKINGLKTEPAFAVALGLDGDPYRAVLQKGRELGLF